MTRFGANACTGQDDISHLLVLLAVHGRPGQLGGLETQVVVALHLGAQELEHLGVDAHEGHPMPGVDAKAAKAASLRPGTQQPTLAIKKS